MVDMDVETGNTLHCEELLGSDHANLYKILHPTSKQLYLDRVVELAKTWRLAEVEICKAAVALSSEHPIYPDQEQRLQSHVGYYLLDDAGLLALAKRLGLKATGAPSRHVPHLHIILSAYVFGILLLTVGYCLLFIHSGDPLLVSFLVIPCFLLLAAFTVKNWIVTWLDRSLKPRFLPQLDLRSGVTAQNKTLVAIPALLLDKDHVEELIETLKIHFAAVQDPNVLFVLLTDLPDSDREHPTEQDKVLIDFCIQAVSKLNEDPIYVHWRPFVLLHRNHHFSPTQGQWMGWERKRGKLHQLVSYIVSGADPFAERAGDMHRLRDTKYVIVLDEDSRIEENTVQLLVGTHAHPLNHPHIEKAVVSLSRGYGILQPAIHFIVDKKKNNKGPLVAGRVFLQDVFEQCSFCGKGIIHIRAYHRIVGDAVPPERVLSHDIVESALLRTGAVSNASVCEPMPIVHETGCLSRHRWIRGDWQNARFLIFGLGGQKLSAFGKVLISDLLLNSLLPIAITIVILRGIAAVHFGLVVVILISTSAMYLEALWIAAIAIRRGQLQKACRAVSQVLMFPLWVLLLVEDTAHRATISADAICRTVYRMFKGRKLLEWQTTASAQKRKARLNVCKFYRVLEAVLFSTSAVLAWTSQRNIPLCILLLLWAVHPRVLFSPKNSAHKADKSG